MMKKISLLIFILSVFSLQSFSQKDKKNKDGQEELNMAESSAKMIAAKHEYNDNNMRGALTLFRAVIKSEANNASARYWTAKCHYELKKYKLAKKYLIKSIDIDPENHKDIEFFFGMIEHRLANTTEAIGHFNKFIKTSKNKAQIADARTYAQQCNFAEYMMKNPVNITVNNIGDNVNSRFDDYTPSITADGKRLVFTSRRSDTKGGEIDENSDYKFFEDIYSSEWNEEKQEWSRAEALEGKVNTESYDAVLSIAPSGDYIFVYKNNINSQGDIFISHFKPESQTWIEPEKMPRPINTSFFESSVSVTADGNDIYFISERTGGEGRGDIYVSHKTGGNSWSNPKNLGEIINTKEDEKFVFIHPNGKTLYFASEGHQSMGSYDIFKSELVNDEWSLPLNLGYPINTVNEESTFSLTSDNKSLLIAAEYEDTHGERDIYIIDVSKYDLLSGDYNESSFGTVSFEVKDNNNKTVRAAEILIYYENYTESIITIETDKNGIASVNLPLNKKYKATILGKKSSTTDTFELMQNTPSETALTRVIKLK